MSTQRDEAWLKSARREEIAQAHVAGELDELLGREVHDIPATGQLDQMHLDHMTPQQIEAARIAGQLDDLLGVEPRREPSHG